MVSAAKLRKAQQEAEATRPYAQALSDLISRIRFRSEDFHHPLMKKRDIKRVELVLFTSDRGLCGSFNNNLIRSAEKFIEENKACYEEIYLTVVGKKARDYFRKHTIKPRKEYLNPEREVSFERAKLIANELIERYLSGAVDSVFLIYPFFKSPMVQIPKLVLLLPFDLPEKEPLRVVPVDYIYEPDAKTILDQLLPRQVRFQLYWALLETRASEHGARMSAMDLASTNAMDVISELTLKMNRARQESITKELLDIVTGAEALKK